MKKFYLLLLKLPLLAFALSIANTYATTCTPTSIFYTEESIIDVPCVEVDNQVMKATFKLVSTSPEHIWELKTLTPVNDDKGGARAKFSIKNGQSKLDIPLLESADGGLWHPQLEYIGQDEKSGKYHFKVIDITQLDPKKDISLLVFHVSATDTITGRRTNKVDICHNGKTINVAEPAVKAHLNHGDTIGKCGIDEFDKVDICHDGKTVSILESEIEAHLSHGDKLGKCEIDEFDGITAAVLKVKRVEIKGTDTTMNLEISGDLDLIKVISGESQLLGEIILPANTYIEQVRFILDSGSYVISEGKQYGLTVPSGEQTGLKIIGDWTLIGGKMTQIQLDFGLEDIRFNRGKNEYRMKPVVKVIGVKSETVNQSVWSLPPANNQLHDGTATFKTTVSPDADSTLEIGDGFSIFIPKGAVSEPITVWGFETDYYRISSIYTLEPSGTQFLQPITVNIKYNPATIPPNYNEEDLVVLHNNTPVPTFVDTSTKVLTAQVNHFSSFRGSPSTPITTINGNYQYIDETMKDPPVHIVLIDRASTEYELKIIADERNDGNFNLRTISELAANYAGKDENSDATSALLAINGMFWEGDEGTSLGQTGSLSTVNIFNNILKSKNILIKDGKLQGQVMMGFGHSGSEINIRRMTSNINNSKDHAPEFEAEFAKEFSVAYDNASVGQEDTSPSLDSVLTHLFGSSTTLMKNGECFGDKSDEWWSAIGYSSSQIVLITTKPSNYVTTSYDDNELCAIFERYEVKNAVRLDGGPSVGLVYGGEHVNPLTSSIVRKKYGKARYIAYAIALVKKDKPEPEPKITYSCHEFNNSSEWDKELCQAIGFLDATGITMSKPDFRPDDGVTRGEMAAFLSRAYEYEKSVSIVVDNSCINFSAPFSEEIAKIMKLGFANCVSYDKYRATDNVNRAEMAKFVIKFADSINYQSSESCSAYPIDIEGYGDLTDYMKKLADEGLTTECGDKYDPERDVTRGEMARFIYRLLVNP